MKGLDLIDADFVPAFAVASAERQQRAIWVACKYAVEVSGLTDTSVATALRKIHAGERGTREEIARFEAIAVRLDTEAGRIREKAEAAREAGSPWARVFDQARAATALANALGSRGDSGPAEAIYEAWALPDRDRLATLIKKALSE